MVSNFIKTGADSRVLQLGEREVGGERERLGEREMGGERGGRESGEREERVGEN